ncbi:MAG: xanthine dehydrogenase accessory protein XdhC [Myxococcales bacterium]|nr:xanthine dehydrogenase accessory protein XdhC [Myxococcales bacterium]
MSASFAALAALEAARRPFVLATVIETGGSTPRHAGARMAVHAGGAIGTVGGGAFEHRVIAVAEALLADGARQTDRFDVHLVRDLGMCCGGKMSVFLEKVEPAPRLRIYGAGHVGAATARVAQLAGFAVRVIDARAEWADPTRFPAEVQVEDAEPEDHLRGHPTAADEFVVVVTHDHALDEAMVRHLLGGDLTWLGLIGSRGKWGRFRKRLSARGLDDAALDRVRCPVGLDIGALTPEEIAVSIVAELITVRRGGPRWNG